MAESELETRLNKKNTEVQNQVNNLMGQLRRVQTQLTHPAAISTLNKQITSINSQIASILATPAAAKIIYVPDSLTLTKGTNTAGNVASVAVPFDADTYNITEVSGVPGFDIEFTFVAVDKFNRINFRIDYDGGANHRIQVQLYDTVAAAWDDVSVYTDTGGYNLWVTLDGIPWLEYVDGTTSEVKLRLYHVSSGNTSHHTKIDYVSIVQDSDI